MQNLNEDRNVWFQDTGTGSSFAAACSKTEVGSVATTGCVHYTLRVGIQPTKNPTLCLLQKKENNNDDVTTNANGGDGDDD